MDIYKREQPFAWKYLCFIKLTGFLVKPKGGPLMATAMGFNLSLLVSHEVCDHHGFPTAVSRDFFRTMSAQGACIIHGEYLLLTYLFSIEYPS